MRSGKPGPFGVQPALDELRSRGITIKQAAFSIRADRVHFGKMLRGWYRPSWGTAIDLADMLDLPVESLFTCEPWGSREAVG